MTDPSTHPPDPGPGASPEADELDLELEATDSVLRDHLAALLSVPDDLASRTTREVAGTLLRRSTVDVAVDLVSVGWRTTWALFGPDDPEEPR